MTLVLAIAGGGASCSDDGEKRQLAEGCSLNSECRPPLVCTFERCHSECASSVDCQDGERCVQSESASVCLLPDDESCNYDSDCEAPLVCALDRRCRNECREDRDCLQRQICAQGGVCAEPREIDSSGHLLGAVERPGGGDGGAGGASADGDAGAGGRTSGSGGSLGGMGASSGSGGSGGSGGTDAQAGAGGAETGPCGKIGQSCCEGACGASFTTCVEGACAACGSLNEPCCSGDECGQNLTCREGTCSCGGGGEPCCNGTTCAGGTACVGGTCECGKAGGPCCADDSCAKSYACTGQACSCVLSCGSNSYNTTFLRSDGSAWLADVAQPATTAIAANGALLTGLTELSSSHFFACGVHTDTTVWCFMRPNETNSYGQLGNGTTQTSTSGATQVVVVPGGPAFTGVAHVAAGDYCACAVTQAGRVRCWGYNGAGSLGNGTLDDSSVPVEVVDAQGNPLTDVADISAGSNHVCARKTDGTLWCWGDNTSGELGIGSTDPRRVNPAQVTALGSNVLKVHASSYNTCVLLADTSVWCWGDNAHRQLGVGVQGDSSFPVQVLTGPSAPALTGVVSVTSGYTPLALKADRSLWGWGSNNSSGYAELFSGPNGPESAVWRLTSNDCFIRRDGSVSTSYQPPPCP